MDKLKKVTIKGANYYLASDIKVLKPELFKGDNNRVRKVVSLQNIPKEYYILALPNIGGTEFKIYTDYNRANLYLHEDWVKSKITVVKSKYPNLPLPIKVEEGQELFQSINICGERTPGGIFFSVKDIGAYLEITDLNKKVIKNYSCDIHYKKFSVLKEGKELVGIYFTYSGFMKFIYSDYEGPIKKIEEIRAGCEEILFIHQFGTATEKKFLANKLLGQNIELAKESLKSSSDIPCVYLFTFESKDDSKEILCKFGRTNSLQRRINEHMREHGTGIFLKYFRFVDEIDAPDAELELCRELCKIGKKEKNKEFILLDRRLINSTVKKIYNDIGVKFGRNISAANEAVRDLTTQFHHEIEILKVQHKHEIELLQRDHKQALSNLELLFLRKKK